MKHSSLALSLVCLFFLAPSFAQARGLSKPRPSAKFSREDFMVMNLNRGQDSTGAHIGQSLKDTKLMVKGLDKSLRQMQQIDRQFAKSKGRPDDHFLTGATNRLETALKTAQQLESDLEAARNELKDSIQQALIMSQVQ